VSYKVNILEFKAAMAKRGFNMGQMAAHMGVSRNTLSAVLHGKNPTYPFMCRAIQALGVDKQTALVIFFSDELT